MNEPNETDARRVRLVVAHVVTGQVSTCAVGAGGARVGRAPENDIVLFDPRVGRLQGAFTWEGDALVYEHRRSRNCPSSLHRAGRTVRLDETVGFRTTLESGDELMLGHEPGLVLVRVERSQGITISGADEEEQMHVEKSLDVRGRTLARAADTLGRDALAVLQRFVLEAAGACDVGEMVCSFAARIFDAYPSANHLSVFLTSTPTGTLEPFLAFDRDGPAALEPLSRAIDERVRNDGGAFLFHAGGTTIRASASLKIARVRAGLCAPMRDGERIVGVVQVDRRGKLGGSFHGSDLELLAVFAHQLAVFIDSKATTEKLRLEVATLKRSRAEMAALAYTDPLTSLPNRRLFLDRLEQALARTNRHGRGFALVYIDLDKLKQINDRFGHEFGDLVIRSGAQCLRRCVREPDTVARLGGDEFAIILDGVESTDAAAIVANKIRARFESPLEIENGNGGGAARIGVQASLGIALAPRDGRTAAELLAYADAEMYRDKHARTRSSA